MRSPHSDRLRAGMTLVEIIIVMVVMGAVIAIVGSMLSDSALLRSTKDEAVMLRDAMMLSRRAAIKSNQTVYFEFDLNEDTYRSYRYERLEGELKERQLLKKRELSSSNSLVSIAVATGARISEGKLTIPILPAGVAEELAIYLGPDPDIRSTVIFSRYGNNATVKEGEVEHNLDNPAWEQDLEEMGGL